MELGLECTYRESGVKELPLSRIARCTADARKITRRRRTIAKPAPPPLTIREAYDSINRLLKRSLNRRLPRGAVCNNVKLMPKYSGRGQAKTARTIESQTMGTLRERGELYFASVVGTTAPRSPATPTTKKSRENRVGLLHRLLRPMAVASRKYHTQSIAISG